MNAHKKALGSYNRSKGRVCAEEGESISIVKRREGGGIGIQLRKGYIRPSKSSQMALVFFVGRKRRMVQDYRNLNEWTIKK